MAASATTRAQRKLYAAGLPVACFGKLPLYEDFLRVPGEGVAARAFEAWMDKAFGLRWDDLDGRAETVARPTRMLFVPSRPTAVAVAVLSDSHDKGGLRRFPFALFVELPAGAIEDSSPAFVLGLVPVWRALEALEAEARALGTATEFYQVFRGRKIAPEPDDDASALDAAIAFDAVGGALHGIAGGSASAWRLPFLEGAAVEAQAGAWARLLVTNTKRSGPPSLVLPRTGRDPFAVLLRPLEPPDARLLSERAGRAEGALDLTRAEPAPEAFRTEAARALGDGATWADLARLRLPRAKEKP